MTQTPDTSKEAVEQLCQAARDASIELNGGVEHNLSMLCDAAIDLEQQLAALQEVIMSGTVFENGGPSYYNGSMEKLLGIDTPTDDKCAACGATEDLRGSPWHSSPICKQCFIVWYDCMDSLEDARDPAKVGAESMRRKEAGEFPWNATTDDGDGPMTKVPKHIKELVKGMQAHGIRLEDLSQYQADQATAREPEIPHHGGRMKIRMEIELDYDDELMHGDDEEARKWFLFDILRGNHLVLLDVGDLGDEVGRVRVTSFKKTAKSLRTVWNRLEAIGDPVVVAENIGELVESLEELYWLADETNRLRYARQYDAAQATLAKIKGATNDAG